MRKILLILALAFLSHASFAGTWQVVCAKQGPLRGRSTLPKRTLDPNAIVPTTAPGAQAFYPIPARSVPAKALTAEVSDEHGPINFISLGFGGQIVMRYSEWILNGLGPDFAIVETSYGSPSCQPNSSEVALVEVSEDGFNWHTPGQTANGPGGQYNACHDQSFDISPLMKCQFVRITDRTNPSTAVVGDGNDGFDVDGILTHFEMSPNVAAAAFANPICDYQQGVASQYVNAQGNYPGRGIVGVRKNFANANINEANFPAGALTNPSLRDATSGTYNLWSMGFGGWACMQLPYPVFNAPGPEFYLFETTWQNQPCPNYPEMADISVSADGINWSQYVRVCKDAVDIPGTSPAVDLSQFGAEFGIVNYIRFQDATNPASFGGGADGYDIDNVVISQLPPPIPGQTANCSCENTTSVRLALNDGASTYLDGGIPEEMFALELVGGSIVSDKVSFLATIAESGEYAYSVRNSQGKALLEGQLAGELYSTPTQEIAVGSLPTGVYFLTLNSNSTKETVKFVKN